MGAENENYEVIDIEELESDIEQDVTIDYVEIEHPEDVVINIDEAFAPFADGGDTTKHNDLGGRDDTDQHPIEAITGLQDILYDLAAVKDHYSIHSGFAELRRWLDGGYYKQNCVDTGGVGYFVSLFTDSKNNTYVDICNKSNEVSDIYGVTVASSGFYGYQDSLYNILDPASIDLSDNPNYAKVCLLGTVKVRVTTEDHLSINVGDYVIPNELGYAQKSDNSVGFKVISKGRIESVGDTTTAWYYVEIALVPQNDNVARVMKKIEDTQVDLEGITIQLGGMSDKITDMENSNIQLGKDFEGLKDLVNESTDKINIQLPIMEQKLQDAVEDVVEEANKTINDMTLEYTEAVSKSNEALDKVGDALVGVADLQKNIEPLATWESNDGSKSGVAGFLARAEEDHTELSSLTSAFGENGSNLTAIIQKIDENGAAIQHLVSHVDKYIIGSTSPAYGLSLEETTIIQPGTIYVSTEQHHEKYSTEDGYFSFPFEANQSYIWQSNDIGDYMWTEYQPVSTETSYVKGVKDGDLWYCWQGIYNNTGDKLLYNPGTLYCWDETKGLWVAVASINNNSTSRVVGLVNQTAEKLTSAYTDLEGNMSVLEQEVERISSIVKNTESGAMSKIEQTADDIIAGVYNPNEGSTSLELLLNGIQSMSSYGGRTRIAYYLGEPNIPDGTKKYAHPPMWDGDKFVFSGESKEDGIYYLDTTDDTKYYKIVNDGYEHYTIGSQAIALLETQVDDNKSEIESLTKFETDTSETLTALKQQSNANEAKIASVAAGEYVVCSNINLEPTDDEITQIPSTRYTSAPKWTEDKFVFNEADASSDGVYYMIEGDDLHYYKLLADGKSYEQYALASTGSAEIMQLVTKNGSSIGMIVKNDKVDASVIVEAINDKESSAIINADKINLQGYVTVESLSGEGTTTIDGSNITTGAIKSNNYIEPLEGTIFSQAGTKFNLTDGSINSENFDLSADGNVSIAGKITATSGYIGNDINGFVIQKKDSVYTYTVGVNGLSGGIYYFKHNGKFYSFEANDELIAGTEIEANCSLKVINIGDGILTESEESPADATPLTFKDVTHYYLGNNQISYNADGSGKAGVYIGPDGIGLGNGNFYVDNVGNLTLRGKVQWPAFEGIQSSISSLENGLELLVVDDKINSAGIVAAINDDTSEVTISANKINLTAYAKTEDVYDEAYGAAEQAIGNITLTTTNGETSSTIKIKHDGVEIDSAVVSFDGVVTFSDLETEGNTTINGSNITTGIISAEYISAEIAQVAGSLQIGYSDDELNAKAISFVGGTSIYTYTDYTGNPPSGIAIQGSSILLLASYDSSGEPYIWAGNNSSAKRIATQEWVQSQGFGGGSSVAVFG